MTKLKIIFMGTPDFAVPVLQSIASHPDFEVSAVVTQEDKKVGRKQEITFPIVKKAALELGLPVLQPVSIKKNNEFIKLLKKLEPDFLVVVAYGQILPPELLKIPKYDCINIHPSLLPKYRGATPVEEALLQGDKETGLTIMKMSEKLDSGDIYFVKKVPIDPNDNALTLRAKLSLIGAQVLPYVLKDIAENILVGIPQIEANATYCHKIEKDDGLIDPKLLTAEEIHNRIRAYYPWPSCFLMIGETRSAAGSSTHLARDGARSAHGSSTHLVRDGKRLKILEASIDSTKDIKPGTVLEIDKKTIGIGTKKGLLIPKKVQLEGKSAMMIENFLAGNRDLLKNL